MLRAAEIWQGTGVELYREGHRGTQSISFDKQDVRKAIQAINWLSTQSQGSGTQIGGTRLGRTRTTIKMEDYQGRKLSIRCPSEVPEAETALAKWV